MASRGGAVGWLDFDHIGAEAGEQERSIVTGLIAAHSRTVRSERAPRRFVYHG